MDIYPFFNSKDIAEYLKSLNYAFTLPEAAFIVYQSQYRTLEEKFTAWQELIDTMPDCSMPERFNMREIPGFHRFLKDYTDLLKNLVSRFYEADGAIYTYELYEKFGTRTWKNDGDSEEPPPQWTELGEYFANAESALAHFEKNKSDYTEDGLQRLKLRKIPLLKKENPDRHWYFQLEMTPDLDLISPDCSCDLLTDEEDMLLRQFDGMCFAFPTPFHRGDILIDRSAHGRQEPFVLDHISTWNAKTLRQNGYSEHHPWVKDADQRLQKLLQSADSSDMNYAGCYLDCREGAFPALYGDNFWTYLNLERYTQPLQGMNRVLKAVSSAMTYDPETGFFRIGPELLCNATWQILTEQTAKLSRSFLEIQYTEEGLQLAGLKGRVAYERQAI